MRRRRAPAEVRYYGICHHSPRCSKSLLLALDRDQPDVVLVEGPPEATPLLSWIGHPELVPPVAILTYAPAHPGRSILFPLAEFSPEWQALLWGRRHGKRVALIDWPHRFRLTISEGTESMPRALGALTVTEALEAGEASESYFALLARLVADCRHDVRASPSDLCREAWKRRFIDRYRFSSERIAVICGAWHLPGLTQPGAPPPQGRRVVVKARWVPYTHDALRQSAMYGAGTPDPAWAEHLWRTDGTSRVCRWFFMRAQRGGVAIQDVVTASWLAETLAVLRRRLQPGPEELRQSWLAVRGLEPAAEPLDHLGRIPAELGNTPLVEDFLRRVRTFGLQEDAEVHRLHLSTDESRDREVSRFFHLSVLLGLPWAVLVHSRAASGRRYELWEYEWTVDVIPKLIHLSHLGASCDAVARHFVVRQTATAGDPTTAAIVLSHAAAAELKEVIDVVIRSLSRARRTFTIPQLLTLFAEVAGWATWSDAASRAAGLCRRLLSTARQKLARDVGQLVRDTACLMSAHRNALHLSTLRQPWCAFLRTLAGLPENGAEAAGLASRLLLEAGEVRPADWPSLVPRLQEERVLAWWSGFLRGSLSPLLTSSSSRAALERWVSSLTDNDFLAWLPLLRQAFAAAPLPQRMRLLEALEQGELNSTPWTGLLTDEAAQTLHLLWQPRPS